MTHWTKEPPTEPGFYWLVDRQGIERAAEIWRGEDGALRVFITGCEYDVGLGEGKYWQRIAPPREEYADMDK